ncbi:MAG: Serine/threonine protein kinase, partial [uncultured Pseudonocardia sp.]
MVDGTPDGGILIGERYLLGEVVGCGASAVVHRAEDVTSGQVVAVKLFTSSGSAGHRAQQRREIEALSSLQHPGLVRLLDGDGTGPRPFVVTEFVDGPSLAEVIHDGPLTPPEVHRLAAGLAAALAHVHEHGFVHRDVKPSNVLLDGDRPRLVDFGIARALDGTVATATGAVVGTAAYMAPEQVRGDEVTAAADVYALGLVLIEALTGRREYPGNAVESAIARLHRPPVVPDGASRPLRRTITDMTRTEPEHRPTAAAVAARLGGEPTVVVP